jgi:hypothetical protein
MLSFSCAIEIDVSCVCVMSERDFFDAKTFLLMQFNVTYVHVKLSCVIECLSDKCRRRACTMYISVIELKCLSEFISKCAIKMIFLSDLCQYIC